MGQEHVEGQVPAAGGDATAPRVLVGAGAGVLTALVLEVERAGASVPGSPCCARPVRWNGLEVGGQRPVVAVATTGGDPAQVSREVARAAGAGADLVELRLDLLAWDDAQDPGGWMVSVDAAVEALASVGHEPPLLLTLRTRTEGGGADLSDGRYRDALLRLVDALDADGQARDGAQVVSALDVELARGVLPEVYRAARDAGVDVVGSSHDFAATPPLTEILDRLHQMEEQGAAVAKIALTPTCPADVTTLLEAASRARAGCEVPLVAVSMGSLGAVTRLVGGVFGSAVTFATAGGEASAPGQPGIEEALAALDWLDRHRGQASR